MTGGKTDQESPSLAALIADLDEERALGLVAARASAGVSPLTIIEECESGMRYVGEHYQSGRYFISGLIMAGEIFREAVEILAPMLPEAEGRSTSGKILLATVQGDIHDLGKSIVDMLLRSYGFTVYDLGVDVPPDEVARKAAALAPDVVGLSGLLTIAVTGMQRTVEALLPVAQELARPLPIIIGGGMVNQNVLEVTGADLWANDAAAGVRQIREMVAAASS